MTVPRRLYLVIFAAVLIAAAMAAFYVRRHQIETAKAVANCDTPALPPPPSAAPPPKLPGFQVEAACGPGEAAKPKLPAAENKK